MHKVIPFLLLATLSFATRAQITSTFDTDADGWTCSDNNLSSPLTVNYNTTGGNPGGHISAGTTSTQPFFWVSPAKFGGNIAYFSYGQELTFDMQLNYVPTLHGAGGLGDVQIRNASGQVLVVNLPSFPAQAPAWSTHTVRLDETAGWRMGSTIGALATKTDLLEYLSSAFAFRLSIKYTGATTFSAAIDNVVLNQRAIQPAPAIGSLSATSGNAGTSITINGNNFGATAANNAVYFGGVAASIISANPTSLTVTVPAGAQYGPITVINKTSGLARQSSQPFIPTFSGGGRIVPDSFDPKFDITLSDNYGGLTIADIDGDGWNDLAVANRSGNSLSLYRNLGTGGDLTTASFAAPVVIPGVGNQLYLFMKDLDNDGRLDIVSNFSTGFVMSFATLRNTSSPGTLSFDAAVLWPGLVYSGFLSEPFDMDGDGLVDLIAQHANGSAAPDLWIAQNLSTPGNILFATSISYFGNTLDAGAGVSHGDLDGDGKKDLIIKSGFGGSFSIAQNNSTPGVISFGTPLTFSSVSSGGNVTVADFNLDGKNDLAWKNGFSSDDVHIRINTNSGGALALGDFVTEIILDSEVSNYGKLSLGDINGDGRVDIMATDNDALGIFENRYSGGAFDASDFVPGYRFQGNGISTYPEEGQAADLNGDGRPDIVMGITNTSPNRLSIYENKNIHAPEIFVTTVSPLAAPVGSTVTITGSNFSPVLSENSVWFGAVKATILTATANQLTASVPPGAGFGAVSVTKAGLISRYHLPFQTTFSSGVTFDNTHFAAPVEFTLAGADFDIEVADFDGDGKPDILAEGGTSVTTRFRNTHTAGVINISSLTANGTLANTFNAKAQDLDGDGLLDLVGLNNVKRNNSTAGNISFLADVSLGIGAGNADFADLNRDGNMDIILTNGGSAQLLVIENLTANLTGNFVTGSYPSFSNDYQIAKSAPGGGVVAADFDADGFPDVVATNPATDNISIFQNVGAGRVSATSLAVRPNMATGDNPGRIYKGDFDADGKLDLMLYHGTGTSSTVIMVFHNQSVPGTINFNSFTLTMPSNSSVAHIDDLDGDGKPEILVTSESGNRFSIFKNIHISGALTAASFAAPFNTTVTAPRGITTGDLNLDGKPEIIITRAAGFLAVYENLVGNPSIASFNPTSGPVGTTVTITGANFSTTPADNIVTFNGIVAAVTASTATSITTSVPAGATTGVISVTVSGALGVSASPFTVTTPVLPPGLVWARANVGTTDTYSDGGVATDASGNVFTAGRFLNTTDFDPGPGVLNLTSAGIYDIYVSKLNASGDLAWAFSMGGISSDEARGIITDATGNVYVSGTFAGTVDFDPGPGVTNLTGGGGFLCKFDTNGNLISASVFPISMSGKWSMAVDLAGNLYITDDFSGTTDFDPGAGTFTMTSAGSSDIFVLKLSPTGTFIWARRMGSTLLDRGNALALDATGNVHLTGSFNGTVDFDPGAGVSNLTSAGSNDTFILKLDNAGNFVWARRIGGTSALDGGNGIALDGNNNVLITGRFDGTVDFDPGAAVDNLTAAGGGDAFVLKLTSAGNFVWARSMGGTFADEGFDIICDAFNNVYTTGDFRSNPADFDPGSGTFNLSPTGSQEVFLSGLDAAGNFMWATASQGAAGSSVYQPELSSDGSGNIILIGVIEDQPADLDPGICVTSISTNGVTAFITKLRPGTVSICASITITTQPSDVTVCFGQTSPVSFTVNATGTTNITYQWERQQVDFTFSDVVDGGPYSGATTPTLIVNPALGLVSTVFRCRINGDVALPQTSTAASVLAVFAPASPTTTDESRCGAGSVTLTATGGSAGQYRWYTVATGGTSISGEVNNSYITPTLSATTTYYVAVGIGACESARAPVIATINAAPAKPTITSSITPVGSNVSVCSSNVLTLSAPANFTTYTWSSGGSSQQITPSTSGTYSVIVTNATGCSSAASDPLTVTVIPAPCSNQAPVIAATSGSTQIEGKVSLDLLSLITDADNNIDVQSLKIKVQPTSGAKASINASGQLELDYQGIAYSGTDRLTVEVCDLLGDCSQREIIIEVIGDLNIYNGISPNGDGLNDTWIILYIDALAETRENKVSVYNRWGDLIWEAQNYDNQDRVFKGLNKNGNEVSSGTYFYKIEFSSGRKAETGYLSVKR